ncbi:M23 family metallopeptidase [Micromonospora yasonensis]|uniref:M23 family metallopeptidase n=1 Tax=Micromonospora yasonensis TaxID=1128667 RepID=UPI00222F2CF0|nr:M23 family metallopeptidase [Micromonospora yasonensis]MCW3840582.1 M23 family metallopeptidase [Micromonospora yasonensis]
MAATTAATLTVTAWSLPASTGEATAGTIGPLPLPSPLLSLPLPLPSVTLPTVEPPPLPALPPPIRRSPTPAPTSRPGTPPGSAPSTAAGAPPSAAPVSPGGPFPSPGSAAASIGADPGADLYPQPPVDAATTPQARQVARLADVQHRIQYLQNILARTRDDLARAQREPDPVLQLLTALTTGGDPAAAPPIAVADSANLVDTPTGRAAALSAAIASGQAELARRQQDESRIRREIDLAARRAAIPAQAPARTRGGARLGQPLAGRLTSRFGVRFDPYYHVWQLHPGVDLAAPVGTPIVAAADGRVTRAGWYGGYGNYTCVDHGRADGQRLSTCYGHQSRLLVSPGQRVRAGQVIGLVGSTGASTGPHLHFEVRLGGRAVDPLPWI